MPPAQNSLWGDLIGALCTGFNLGDGLARLRIQLFVLNPVNVALLTAQLYAQLRSLSKASDRASACLPLVDACLRCAQTFDPLEFDPFVCLVVCPMLVNLSFLLLGWTKFTRAKRNDSSTYSH